MNAPFEWRHAAAQSIGRNGAAMALRCALNVHAAVDRRSPEAVGLAKWLAESAAGFDLPDNAVPGDADSYGFWPRRGVSEQDWRKIDSALTQGGAAVSGIPDAHACRWVEAMSPILALDALESHILALVLYYKVDKRVERLFDTISVCREGPTYLHRDATLIALLLQASSAEVETRLTAGAKLLASGLLHLGRSGGLGALERLKALIRQGVPPAADVYDQLLGAAVAAPLPWESFTHLGQEAEIAASVLRAALGGRENGINLLLYGAPGTGKTSFAATLAERVGARLRPVAEADESGGEPCRGERLAGLRLAQRLVAPGDTLLLFDEAEDLFVERNGSDDEPATNSRVFMHRLLERMAVPVIWTANDISMLGPAVLRRMTMCLELKVPNLVTRTRLWRQMGEAEGIVLPEADAARLARLVPAAPAVASTALRAARLAGGQAETARVIVEGVARAVHGGALPAPERAHDGLYDAALVNADCDLGALVDRLARPDADRAVSFLLSGPPGSGKSAWVRHLADRMGLQVLHKRASDILDAYVGGTERNIADAFAEARDSNAFLVFDEADSLLLDRVDAVRSWEISQVNEMLTWMEEHALPFACTTNLLGRLDRASLRRFLVKVRFDWLTQAQSRLAFRRFFGLAAPPVLDGLTMLTPADFALVRRRAAMVGTMEPLALVRLLAAECEGRVGGARAMGFAARMAGDCDGG
ncbi:AAA family ATPase [Rhodopila sp.]|uniref:AAA family ATPase n=1 Tax=Rhodopila sp. TaxID=2480087 RepID=UPI003D11C185